MKHETPMKENGKENITKYIKDAKDMLYLSACALHDVVPDKAVMESLDPAAVYQVAKKQSMTAVSCYGLEKWLDSPEGENWQIDAALWFKWTQARDMAIRKNTMLDIEREKILAYMEEQHIWHMPLKGSILKDLYPALGMRQMSDNDILVDPAYREALSVYMLGQGYELDPHEEATHDAYLKRPVYNFEIHNALFSDEHNPIWEEYYWNLTQKLERNLGKDYEYHFRDEDFYVYIMVHAYKHYASYGNGVRHLMDVQVYLNQKPAMDWEYIRRELAYLGVTDYENTVRSLAGKLFDKKCLKPMDMQVLFSDRENDLLEFSICADTYGNRESWTQNNLRRSTNGESVTIFGKIKYLWKRMVYLEGLYSYYPKLANYKILRPFLYVGRIFIGITQYGNRLWPELKTLLKIKR